MQVLVEGAISGEILEQIAFPCDEPVEFARSRRDSPPLPQELQKQQLQESQFQRRDAFVLHVQSTGKKVIEAVTWGGTGFETGAGVAVSGATIALAATTLAAPPYSLLNAAARLSAPRSTFAAAAGVLNGVAGVVANPGAGASEPNGSTTFSGNAEAALVRIRR